MSDMAIQPAFGGLNWNEGPLATATMANSIVDEAAMIAGQGVYNMNQNQPWFGGSRSPYYYDESRGTLGTMAAVGGWGAAAYGGLKWAQNGVAHNAAQEALRASNPAAYQAARQAVLQAKTSGAQAALNAAAEAKKAGKSAAEIKAAANAAKQAAFRNVLKAAKPDGIGVAEFGKMARSSTLGETVAGTRVGGAMASWGTKAVEWGSKGLAWASKLPVVGRVAAGAVALFATPEIAAAVGIATVVGTVAAMIF